MSEFRARISRVIMKGGAIISVLPTPMDYGDPEQPENWRGKLIANAKVIAGYDEPGSRLDGYLVIGLFSDGSSSTAFRLPERIPKCLVPAYIAELLRRDLIMDKSAEDVFDRMFAWVE